MSIEFAGAAKARELRTYFSRHGRIYIVVDATGDAVTVPEHLHGDPALRLVLNVRMPQHIHIRADTLDSDFTFSGSSFHCVIPMRSIWAAYVPGQQLENGILWADDIPETIRAVLKAVRNVPDEAMNDINSDAQSSPAPDAAISATVQDAATSSDAASSSGKRAGHLRVVK